MVPDFIYVKALCFCFFKNSREFNEDFSSLPLLETYLLFPRQMNLAIVRFFFSGRKMYTVELIPWILGYLSIRVYMLKQNGFMDMKFLM